MTERQWSPYEKLIRDATCDGRLHRVVEIEELMRLCNGGTLDNLSTEDFKQLAKDCQLALEN